MFKKLNRSNFIFLVPIWLFLAVFSNVGNCYLLNLSNSDTFLSSPFIKIVVYLVNAVFLFFTCFHWGSMEDRKLRIRRIFYSFTFAFFLALSYVLGYQLKVQGMTDLGAKGKLFIFIMSVAVGITLTSFSNLWFALMDSLKKKPKDGFTPLPKKDGFKLFLISFAVIFICWLPAFLAYYPAIMSYDFNRQMTEAYGGYLNTHHPLIHTCLIRLFYLFGVEIGSYQVSFAIFSILQMLVLSATFAYSCSMVSRLTGKKWPCLLSAAFFALLPIHPVLALCMTKDILFTAFFLLLVTLMLEFRMAKTKKMKIVLPVAMLLTGILMILFRNNAIYAFVVFSIFYLLFSRKQRLPLFILCILIVVGGYGSKTLLQKATNATDGSNVEMVSVMIQQFNLAAYNHMGFHTQEQYDIINYYVPEECWDEYNPTIADGVKHHIYLYCFDHWDSNIVQTIKDWATIGLAYPNDYLDAFLHLTIGYWFMDDMTHAEVLGYGEDSDFGLIYTFNASGSQYFEGIESHSYLPGVEKWYSGVVNANNYQNLPLLSLLFKPAFYTWVMILCMMSVCYLKQTNKTVLFLYPFIYFLTLLLGPVVNFRYIYPIIAVTPLFIAWVFAHKNWINLYTALPDKKKKD